MVSNTRQMCHSGQRRRSRRRGPDGQEMRNLNKQQIACVEIPATHWSDDESELPPSKRARDNGYASDHTAITDYEDLWSQTHLDGRPPHAILTPPSLVSNYFRALGCKEISSLVVSSTCRYSS